MANFDLVTASTVHAAEQPILQRTLVAAEAITAGAPVYITTAGKFGVADANDNAKDDPYGIALRTVAAGQPVTAVRRGTMEGWDFGSTAYWAPVYLSNDVGRLGDSAGSTSVVMGKVVPALAVSLGESPDKLLEVDVP